MKTIEEWNSTISDFDEMYIYGAGKVAKKIAKLLMYSGKFNNLRGYVISEIGNNPSDIDGVPVIEIKEIRERNIPVLVSLSEVYHPSVFENLEKLGFKQIIPVHKFFSIDLYSNNEGVADYDTFIDTSIELQQDLKDYREDFVNRYFLTSHAFGSGGFYQSFPLLGIRGTRDTSLRIKKYGLPNLITKDTLVLDIGCNIGFLDMEISDNAKFIIGLEYSESLVDLANDMTSRLNKTNIEFISGDYSDWQRNNEKKFDIIFSFAVHGWLNVKPQTYAAQIYNMLESDGVLIFESQQLSTDKMFDDFVNSFIDCGLTIINDDIINDDGKTDRRFVVLKK